MTAVNVKKALYESICSLNACKWQFSSSPEKDFTRNRKLPFDKMVAAILAFQAGSLNHELREFFTLDANIASSSAFIQQRAKILPEAFETLFHRFTDTTQKGNLYKGHRLLAVDGSDFLIAGNPSDPDSYFTGTEIQKPYNLLHLNTMYDLSQHIYVDAVLQKKRKTDESSALTKMVDRSNLKNALVLADRGYESYNNLAHIQEKGWKFLIRIKNGSAGIASGLQLPHCDEFDVPFHLNLTRQQANTIKTLLKQRNSYRFIPSNVRFDFLPKNSGKHAPADFFCLSFRVLRFPISDSSYETIITNLDARQFPASEIKKLYALRWGIETSFRDLKYTLGLLHFHAKKVEFVCQEIFAKLTMYNFCELITQSVVIQQGQRKHNYRVNFSDAVHICLQFFLGKVTPPNVETLLMKYISPIRPGRKNTRKLTIKSSYSFFYRVA
jgi:hypothetical protein